MTHSGDGLPGRHPEFSSCERVVRSAWREILSSAPTDQTDFFLSGGDSLLAARLILSIREQLGIQLELRDIFDAPSPMGIAQSCHSKGVEQFKQATPQSLVSEGKHTLSFSQERMWFMDALATGTAAYHVAFALRFRGRLSETALTAALSRVVNRHPVLRTTFPNSPKGPELTVLPHEPIRLTKSPLSATEGSSLNDRMQTELTRLSNRPFDLAEGPLLRPHLISMGKDDAVLLICMHHIIADQWSFDVLIRELARFYRSELGEHLEIPAIPAPTYEQYASWHRNWFLSHRIDSDLSYWQHQLAGLERVSLTADLDPPPQHSFQGARLRVPLSQSVIEQLRKTGAAHKTSLASVLLTAFFIAVNRHTGAEDIGIGVPAANRHHPGSSNLIGTLVNTLVVRTRLKNDTSVSDALIRVRDTLLDAIEHQDTPFELLIRELRQSRDPSRSPYFSVMFNMLNIPPTELDFGSVDCTRLDVNRSAAQFDLTLTIDAVHDQSVCFDYSTALFHRSAIERFSVHYFRILDALADEGHLAIQSIPILCDQDLALLNRWSRGPINPEANTCLPALFEAQAHRTPDRIAIRFNNEALTYSELGREVNRLTNSLRQKGIGKGHRIGVCLWRSPLMVIAPLAVLRTGACYLPLDSRYPAERINYFIEDAAVSMVLTQASLLPALELLPGSVQLVDIESRTVDGPEKTESNYQGASQYFPALSDTAYIIYTSGSTGLPKGVEVLHASVANFLHSMLDEPGLDSSARFLAVTPLTFDISVLELFLPLCCGAEVVLANREQLTDGKALASLMEDANVTDMQATPSTWQFLIDAGWRGRKGLRILVGGEPLRPELARELMRRADEVWNMYGPTETTVWSSCWRVDSAERNKISLGHPIANTEILILDSNMQQMPIGAEGELCIAGAGLAAGYLNRRDLTDKAFVSDTRWQRSASKIYRTGDRARWRHDGSLAFRGRSDDQIKIRGHRVELGEIESRLTEHDHVAAAVVTTNDGAQGETLIVAFIVPKEEMPSSTDLRIYLKKWLPDYMLPRHYIELDALPMLSSGKLNRVQLAGASIAARESARSARPRDETEQAIHDVWCEILGLSPIGLDDNFFDIGGHSLLAARIMDRISSRLEEKCAMPLLFRFPTIATLSAAIQSSNDSSNQSILTLQGHGNGIPVYCIGGSRIYQWLAQQLAPDYPVHAAFSPKEAIYWSTSSNEPGTLPGVHELATEYLQIVKDHHSSGPFVLAGFSFGGVIAYEMALQLSEQDEPVPLLVILDSDPPRCSEKRPAANFSQVLKTPIESGRSAFRRISKPLLKLIPSATATTDYENMSLRDQRYLDAMHSYGARRYPGKTFLVESISGRTHDPGYDWNVMVRDIEVSRLQCEHLDVLSPPNIDSWVSRLRNILGSIET